MTAFALYLSSHEFLRDRFSNSTGTGLYSDQIAVYQRIAADMKKYEVEGTTVSELENECLNLDVLLETIETNKKVASIFQQSLREIVPYATPYQSTLMFHSLRLDDVQSEAFLTSLSIERVRAAAVSKMVALENQGNESLITTEEELFKRISDAIERNSDRLTSAEGKRVSDAIERNNDSAALESSGDDQEGHPKPYRPIFNEEERTDMERDRADLEYKQQRQRELDDDRYAREEEVRRRNSESRRERLNRLNSDFDDDKKRAQMEGSRDSHQADSLYSMMIEASSRAGREASRLAVSGDAESSSAFTILSDLLRESAEKPSDSKGKIALFRKFEEMSKSKNGEASRLEEMLLLISDPDEDEIDQIKQELDRQKGMLDQETPSDLGSPSLLP